MLYSNALRNARNLYNQGNYHCSGSTHKKPLGGDWEGDEVEKQEMKYFRGV